jgi:hypothetical protein
MSDKIPTVPLIFFEVSRIKNFLILELTYISFWAEKGFQYKHQILQLLYLINWRVTVPGQCHALTLGFLAKLNNSDNGPFPN